MPRRSSPAPEVRLLASWVVRGGVLTGRKDGRKLWTQMTEKRRTFEIPEGLAGERLDRALATLARDISRSRLQALIAEGRVLAAGRPARSASAKVKTGQTFAIVLSDPKPAEPQGQNIPLDVLYEDEEVIVLNKPAGLVVHPGPGNPDRTLVNALIAHCGESLKGIGGVLRPGIVHRLDKETSGVMVAAKTERAHKSLVAQFGAREIDRRYQAVVWGLLTPPKGEISGAIGRSPRNRKKMAVLRRGGRPAVTRYRLLKSYGKGVASLVECKLLTGRTHQIRVHMAELGHAILGDPLYGRSGRGRTGRLSAGARESLTALKRQALHAKTLAFTHPSQDEVLTFDTDLPSDIKALICSLETL